MKRITKKIKLDIYEKALIEFKDRLNNKMYNVGFCYVLHSICCKDYKKYNINVYDDLKDLPFKVFKELNDFVPKNKDSINSCYSRDRKGYIKRRNILKIIIRELKKDIDNSKKIKDNSKKIKDSINHKKSKDATKNNK